MDIVWFLLIGLAAGFVAGQLVRGSSAGILGDLIVGVIGAILGGFLFDLVGLKSTSVLGKLITATVGAAVLIVLLRYVNRGSGRSSRR